jgi:hypothetical protein
MIEGGVLGVRCSDQEDEATPQIGRIHLMPLKCFRCKARERLKSGAYSLYVSIFSGIKGE